MKTANPKVAVVLGGGGIKPYSAIPLINFLNEQSIPVDLFVGTSGGSIMVSLLAAGYTTDQVIHDIAGRLDKSTFKVNKRAILGIANLPGGRMDKESALIKSEPIRKVFKDLWGDRRLEDLVPKTIIQVTDFMTGEGIGLTSGLLRDCVYASSAIFPLLPAIKIGDRWLFDGGYSAPVPILQAIRQKAEIIIAVDFLEKEQPDPKGIFENLMHTGRLTAKNISALQMALSIDLHNAEIIYLKIEFEKTLSFWEIDKFPLILETGEKALDKIRKDLIEIYKSRCQKATE